MLTGSDVHKTFYRILKQKFYCMRKKVEMIWFAIDFIQIIETEIFLSEKTS